MPMAERKEFTVAQATDLARYFLGSNWIAHKGVACFYLEHREDMDNPGSIIGSYVGAGWREVFRKAGIALPLRPRYIALGVHVMRESKAVCTAISGTAAKQIAAALNEHEPDRRGI
jgi:hypothetical protein